MSLRQEIYGEIKELARSARQKARQLSRAGKEKDARRALALAAVADIWAKEWEPLWREGDVHE